MKSYSESVNFAVSKSVRRGLNREKITDVHSTRNSS